MALQASTAGCAIKNHADRGFSPAVDAFEGMRWGFVIYPVKKCLKFTFWLITKCNAQSKGMAFYDYYKLLLTI